MVKLHIKSHAVEYRVTWNQDRNRFDVYRGQERTTCFSYQQGTAIGLAIRAAQLEAREDGQRIVVTSMRNGKRNMEWDGITNG